MKGRVSWDEANLSEIEANKPVRRKISEPKTPYHPMIKEDGSPIQDSVESLGYVLHAEAVRSALNKVASHQNHTGSFAETISSEDDGDAFDEDEDFVEYEPATSFEEHRRAHYDEFKKIKELKRKESIFFVGDESDEDYSDLPSGLNISTRDIEIHSVDDENHVDNDCHEERCDSCSSSSICIRDIHIDDGDETPEPVSKIGSMKR